MGKINKELTGGGGTHIWPTGDLTYAVEMHPIPARLNCHGFFIARIKAPNFDAAMATANERYATSHAALDTRS